MSKIIVGNTLCTIEDEEDIEFLRALDRELSFKVQGAEHTKAFKGYYSNGRFIKWDGIQRILSRDLTFPYGLLERVKKFYVSHGKEVEIENRRPNKSAVNSISIYNRLSELDKKPYQYQLDVIDVVKEKDCGIIRAATGSGKTAMCALMIAYFGKPSIVYVIGRDLLYQAYNFFCSIFGDSVGIVGDGECDIKNINIVSVWTAGQVFGLKKSEILTDSEDEEKSVDKQKYIDIKNMMKLAKVHVFDECHLAACNTIQTISKNINPEHIYGMSASPVRDDGADLLIESIFGSQIVDISASQLIEGGYLVKPIIKFIEVPKYTEDLPKNYPTVYKKYIIENTVRNEYVIKGARKLIEQGYKTLLLYSRLNHGKLLYEELSKHVPCALLSGKDSAETRQKIREQIESGEIKCIVASTIFDIGVDLPALSGLVVAGGGKSSVRALQRIGRVIRKHPSKQHAAVLDFYDQARFLKEHSKIRCKIYSSEDGFDVSWPK